MSEPIKSDELAVLNKFNEFVERAGASPCSVQAVLTLPGVLVWDEFAPGGEKVKEAAEKYMPNILCNEGNNKIRVDQKISEYHRNAELYNALDNAINLMPPGVKRGK